VPGAPRVKTLMRKDLQRRGALCQSPGDLSVMSSPEYRYIDDDAEQKVETSTVTLIGTTPGFVHEHQCAGPFSVPTLEPDIILVFFNRQAKRPEPRASHSQHRHHQATVNIPQC